MIDPRDRKTKFTGKKKSNREIFSLLDEKIRAEEYFFTYSAKKEIF